ncbi:MAG: hypothetical protein PUG11_01530 [Lactobacillus equicursoris]|nr:hypothetical protein [Lactobacillus equicursoris]
MFGGTSSEEQEAALATAGVHQAEQSLTERLEDMDKAERIRVYYYQGKVELLKDASQPIPVNMLTCRYVDVSPTTAKRIILRLALHNNMRWSTIEGFASEPGN